MTALCVYTGSVRRIWNEPSQSIRTCSSIRLLERQRRHSRRQYNSIIIQTAMFSTTACAVNIRFNGQPHAGGRGWTRIPLDSE